MKLSLNRNECCGSRGGGRRRTSRALSLRAAYGLALQGIGKGTVNANLMPVPVLRDGGRDGRGWTTWTAFDGDQRGGERRRSGSVRNGPEASVAVAAEAVAVETETQSQ